MQFDRNLPTFHLQKRSYSLHLKLFFDVFGEAFVEFFQVHFVTSQQTALLCLYGWCLPYEESHCKTNRSLDEITVNTKCLLKNKTSTNLLSNFHNKQLIAVSKLLSDRVPKFWRESWCKFSMNECQYIFHKEMQITIFWESKGLYLCVSTN